MKRKLIQQANQALTITLPIEWTRENNLKAGDEINVELNEKNLILKSEKKIIGRSINLNTIDFPLKMKYIYNHAAYALGIDEIKIESEKGDYPRLEQTIGFVVTSHENNKITVKDISGVSQENLDEVFKRTFQAVINFYDSAIQNVFNNDKIIEEDIKKIDAEINKLTLFLQRSIIKHTYSDSAKGKIMFAYSFALEQIGDEIVRFWKTAVENKIKNSKEMQEIIGLSQEALEKAFDIYYQNSNEKIKELINLKENARKKYSKITKLNLAQTKLVIHSIKIIEDACDLIHLSLMNKL